MTVQRHRDGREPGPSALSFSRQNGNCGTYADSLPSSLGDDESAVEVAFPGEFRAFYLASDGVFDELARGSSLGS